MVRKEWRKPEVRLIRAGSAEFGFGFKDDGDKGKAKNNS